jgi:hypothetical protein
VRSVKKNKEGRWFKSFPFTLKEVRGKLESTFNSLMTWDNFGIYWGIDLIIPPKHYRIGNQEEFLKCFNLQNIRALPLKEIRKKQGRLFWEEIESNKLFDLLPIGSLHLKDRIK